MGGCFKSNTIENCKRRLIDLYMNLLSTMSDILNHDNVYRNFIQIAYQLVDFYNYKI